MKIVVRTPNWLGDALMAFPALTALRRHFPDDEISIIAPDGIGDLYFGPETEARSFRRGPSARGSGLRRTAAELRNHS